VVGSQKPISHVERAGNAIDQGGADEKEEGCAQINRDIVQARLDPRDPDAVQRQPIGGGQHDLEEDEEIEDVAGEEGAVEPHKQELEEAVKARTCRVPAGQGID
jgi:hypothetical protein